MRGAGELFWATCVHEAGHLVVELALGSTPTRAWVLDAPGADGVMGRVETISWMHASLSADHDDGSEHLRRLAAENLVTCLFAGPAAALIVDGVDAASTLEILIDELCDHDIPPASDFGQILALTEPLEQPRPGDREDFHELTAELAVHLLEEHWTLVIRAASLLETHGVLDRDRIYELSDQVAAVTSSTAI